MSNNPLPATTSISEKKEGEYNQHLTNRNLIIPDHYHQISSIPLEDYIERLKRTLFWHLQKRSKETKGLFQLRLLILPLLLKRKLSIPQKILILYVGLHRMKSTMVMTLTKVKTTLFE